MQPPYARGQLPRHVGEQRAGAVAPRLALDDQPPPRLGALGHLVEQDGLADPAQPGQHQPSGHPAELATAQDRVEGGELLRPPGQERRAQARSGGVRVVDGVHADDPSNS